MASPNHRLYKRAECALFRKTNETFGGLSNMAPGFPLEVNGIKIRTSEALYQACRFPHLPDVQRLIIEQTSPMTAKMKSKPYRDQSRADWNSVRVKIMRWCLRVKLAQNWDKFSELLLATGTQSIVEESRKDAFWGAIPTEHETLSGANALGRLLMELREQLRNQDTKKLTTVTPPSISNFLLYNRPIGTIQSPASNRPSHSSPQKPQTTLDFNRASGGGRDQLSNLAVPHGTAPLILHGNIEPSHWAQIYRVLSSLPEDTKSKFNIQIQLMPVQQASSQDLKKLEHALHKLKTLGVSTFKRS